MIDLRPAPTATSRTAGAEPLAGYRLIAPLGRGGFGEVWKCEAPGGLVKAVKFVPCGDDGFRQEMQAFEQIKSLRHPFLLTLERVEVVGSDLVMVMELADGQLSDRYKECVAAGHAGIPRRELLGYMLEAAEALDLIGSKYGLQHLDVKPPNVFLVSGHAKVGDYGLVRRTARNGEKSEAGGFTPKYTPPEVLAEKVDLRSDQYSLALVYAELLSGRFPYPGKSAQEFMTLHMRGTPDLSALNSADRAAVGRALTKDPAGRFPSCLAFVSDLITALPTAGSSPAPATTPRPAAATFDLTVPSRPSAASTHRAGGTPQLVSPAVPPLRTHKSAAHQTRPDDPTVPPPPDTTCIRPPTHPTDPFADLAPVMPVDRLHAVFPRMSDCEELLSVAKVIEVVLRQAADAAPIAAAGKSAADQFRCFVTIPHHMMSHKLTLVAEKWGLTAKQSDPTRVLMRKEYRDPATRPGIPSYTRSGFEVVIELPRPPAVEVVVTTKFFGSPDAAFVRSARSLFPAIFEQARSLLQHVQERRTHPRHRFDTLVRAFPLFTDGQIGKGTDGRLIDVSLGGMQVALPAEVGSDRMFVQFPNVSDVCQLAVYLRVQRTTHLPAGAGVVTAGRFRTDE